MHHNPTKNISVYTEYDINQWQTRYDEVPVEQGYIRAQIEQLESTKKNLLVPIESDIRPKLEAAQHRKASLDARLFVIQYPETIATLQRALEEDKQTYASTKREVEQIHRKINQQNRIIYDLEASLDVQNKRTMIQRLNHDNKKLSKQEQVYLNELKKPQKELAKIEDEIKQKEKEIGQTASSSQTINYANSTSNQGSGFETSINQSTNGYTTSNLTQDPVKLFHDLQTLQTHKENKLTEIKEIQSKINNVRTNLAIKQNNIERYQNDIGQYSAEVIANASTLSTQTLLFDCKAAKDKKYHLENEKHSIDNLSTLEEKIKAQDKSIKTTNAEYERALKLTDFNEINEIETLQQLKEENALELSKITTIFENQELEVANVEEAIQAKQLEYGRLEKEWKTLQSNTFLSAFWKNPEGLLSKFVQNIHASLSSLENEHLQDLSLETRHSILCIRDAIPKVLEHQASTAQMYPDLSYDPLQRTKVLELCGLLWEQAQKSAYVDNFFYKESLAKLLQAHPVASDHALSAYSHLNLVHPGVDDLVVHEKAAFNLASERYTKTLETYEKHPDSANKNVSATGKLLLDLVNQKITDKEPDSYYRYSNLLTAATTYANNPQEQNSASKFNQILKETKDGQPSLGKKIAGVGMMLFGCLSFVGSCALSLIIPAPLSYGCISVVMSASMATFAVGYKLFKGGQSKGMYERLDKYDRAVKHSTLFKSGPVVPELKNEGEISRDSLHPAFR